MEGWGTRVTGPGTSAVLELQGDNSAPSQEVICCQTDRLASKQE